MRGSVVKRGNKYSIVFRDGSRNVNGKLKQIWESGFNTRAEADKALCRRIAEIDSRFEKSVGDPTVEAFLEYWLEEYCKPKLAPNTIYGYSVVVRKHIVPHIGKIKLKKLTPHNIQKLYSNLRQSGLSANSIRHIHNNLHKALEWANKQELIYKNPAKNVDPPTVKRKEFPTLAAQQIDVLLSAASQTEIYLPVMLAALLGLRRGEVLALQWQDVDWDNNTIRIIHSLSYCQKKPIIDHTKTASSRRTLLMPELVSSSLWVEFERQKHCREHTPSFNEQNLICCREDGSLITPNVLQHKYKAILQKAGLPDIRFHDLRHSYATLMFANNIHAKSVSAMLGHSNISITLDTYTHMRPEVQCAAVDVVNRITQAYRHEKSLY